MISLTSGLSRALFGGLFLLCWSISALAAWPACDVVLNSGDSLSVGTADTVYCVPPGDYSPFDISADNVTIRYYDASNPNWEGNPVNLSDSKRAKVNGGTTALRGANQKIYGLYFTRSSRSPNYNIECHSESTGCSFYYIVSEHGGGGGGMVHLDDGAKLYYSVIRNTYQSSDDEHCVVVGGGVDNVEIVGNEIYNCAGDGVQEHPGEATNNLYQDNDIYQEPDFAPFDYAEQGLDFKSRTGDTIANGRRIIGNRIFGFRNGDSSNPSGIIFTTKSGEDRNSGAILVENNILWDIGRPFGGKAEYSNAVTLRGNLFYDNSTGFLARNFDRTEVYYNTFVDTSSYVTDAGGGAATNTDGLCNVMVNSTRNDDLGSGTVFDYNAYYNSDRYAAPGTHDYVSGSSSSANNGSFCFDIKQITNPTRVCIPNAKTTSSSPHANLCSGVQVGNRTGVGIDNSVFSKNAAGIYMLESIHQLGSVVTTQCSDGVDNDGDGLIDYPDDPGCSSESDDSELDEASPACNDGIDNDGDGLIDYPDDPGCLSLTDDDESNPKLTISGPTSGQANELLSYSASASNCTPDVTGWQWTMSGGTPSSSTQPTIDVSYPTEGARSITVTNTACSGAEGSINVNISGAALVVTECDHILSTDASLPFQDQSPPWNVFDSVNTPKQNLIDVECSTEGVVDIWAGNADNPNMYVWHQGAVKLDNGPWQTIGFQGTPHPKSSNWLQGRAFYLDYPVSVTEQESPANFLAAYICQWRNNAWKCGCESSSQCGITGLWSIQRFQEGGATPTPTLTVNGPSNGNINTALEYSASATNCTPNTDGWQWTMTDGTPASATTQTTSVTYASSGDKAISVTNTGCSGAVGQKTVTIGTPTQTTLTISGPLSGYTGETLEYTSSATNCTPASDGWSWTATGGSPASGTSAAFSTSYSTTGSKSITVTNTACSGAQGSTTVTIDDAGGGAPFTAKETYESIGIYWNPNQGDGTSTTVKYRVDGTVTWTDGHPLWWDGLDGEYRGSIVDLSPGTTYNVRVQNSNEARTQDVTTWTQTDELPIGTTTNLSASSSSQVNVTTSGTASGYHLVTGPAGGGIATIDLNYGADRCVDIDADYVIVRGIKCDRAYRNGVYVTNGRHHIVIEDSEFTRWGSGVKDTSTTASDAGILIARDEGGVNTVHHLTIQSNYFHLPRNGVPAATGSTNEGLGGSAIRWTTGTNGQFVIADNTFINNAVNETENLWHDAIGGSSNFSDVGFPGPDSDILRNYVAGAADDCMEIEGGGKNVRIGYNFTRNCFVQIAIAAVQKGPLYMWRNVTGYGRFGWGGAAGQSGTTKWGGARATTHGPVYSYHNSFIGPSDPDEPADTQGPSYGWGGEVRHLISKNNILASDNKIVRSGECYSPADVVANDLVWKGDIATANCNQTFDVIQATPSWESGPTWDPTPGTPAFFELASGSRGYDEAISIPGFNTTGADIGADEADGIGMTFGVAAP